jgi:hypothetical protein
MRMRLLHVSGYPCVFCIRAGRICGCDFDDRDKGEPGVGRDDNRNVMLHGQPSDSPLNSSPASMVGTMMVTSSLATYVGFSGSGMGRYASRASSLIIYHRYR